MNGAEFACAREFLGLTPTWVADRLGVDRRTVWKWEQGKSKLPARAVNEMAGWLETTSNRVGKATLKASEDNGFELLAATDGMDNPNGFPASWQRMWCARVAERTGREIRWMSDDEWREATAMKTEINTGTMTAQEVADLADVHRRTILRAIKRGAFPRAFLLNGWQWRIPTADAKAYIETGRMPD